MIDLIGSQVTQFKVGDRVLGYNDEQFGGHAEYVCIAEDKAIAHMPQTLDFYEAAAITEGAHYVIE
jgi:NADPH:quinone reductase-like Zn-dependent oxidoreductase